MERKGLKVNVDKTKGIQLLFRKKSSVSKMDPCGVYGEWVACNPSQCTKCQRWVNHHCYDVPRQVSLLSCPNVFVFKTCLGLNCSVDKKSEFKMGKDALKEAKKFCYLGDMISCYGGASEVVSVRIGSAWKKLVWKQSLSLKQLGGIYQYCARPVLWYCCETWDSWETSFGRFWSPFIITPKLPPPNYLFHF